MRIGKFLLLMGAFLLVWGIIGALVPPKVARRLRTTSGITSLHLAAGVIVLWAGATWNPEIRRPWTKIFGLFFLALAAADWASSGGRRGRSFMGRKDSLAGFGHLLLGTLFLGAGFVAKKDDVYGEPPGTTMNLRN